jgi:hypothetical protein
MTTILPRFTTALFLLCFVAFTGHVFAQASKWKGMGVSTGAPLPPAENFKPRPHGPELAKAGLNPEVIAKLDIEMQRHVAPPSTTGAWHQAKLPSSI